MRSTKSIRHIIVLLTPILAAVVVAQERIVERNGTIFRTYTATPQQIELFWADETGKPLRQFSALQAALERQSRRVRFMMNAGIFEEGGIPAGLVVINGKTLRSLNSVDGKGNFYLKPNGVFYVDLKGACVVTTPEYAALKPSPRIAIQSGLMLVRGSRIHPAFRAASINRLHRNGVGVRKDGAVVFVITEFGQQRFPNLYEFADFFRAQECPDALFLDGDLSQMVVDPKGPIRPGNHFGAVFVIAEPR